VSSRADAGRESAREVTKRRCSGTSSARSKPRQPDPCSVLNPATAHANRTAQVGLNVGCRWFVGTMLGIGIVILLEMSDRRVRSRMDLDVSRLCRCSACLMHGSHLRGCCLLAGRRGTRIADAV